MKGHEPGLPPISNGEKEQIEIATATGNRGRRLGFLAGQLSVPDDFEKMGSKEIEEIFSDDR